MHDTNNIYVLEKRELQTHFEMLLDQFIFHRGMAKDGSFHYSKKIKPIKVCKTCL